MFMTSIDENIIIILILYIHYNGAWLPFYCIERLQGWSLVLEKVELNNMLKVNQSVSCLFFCYETA